MATKEKVYRDYLKWIYYKIGGGVPLDLLKVLNKIEFTYILPLDRNRAVDGVGIRRRFAIECVYNSEAEAMLDGPCTVLEMLMGLSIRMEEAIMSDNEKGSRVGKWFKIMVDNLGLAYGGEENDIRERVDRFLTRQYQPNGLGNIFYIPKTDRDLRFVEIWYQMHEFIRNYDDND